jgi:hypothetical protein
MKEMAICKIGIVILRPLPGDFPLRLLLKAKSDAWANAKKPFACVHSRKVQANTHSK